jgi:hypothetical protein
LVALSQSIRIYQPVESQTDELFSPTSGDLRLPPLETGSTTLPLQFADREGSAPSGRACNSALAVVTIV